ncbi:hypothetical protein F5Y00DRAFT_259562 [Daldinia vernicosa]|uniref:uncharacterized protein n=1 Tax=Daldinia vernicosa TaxID=114800 RepID=UPI0020071EC2|nr:uncharacterized protein F5Y00DRAFT_259562 [Daldinia vernicosa]KAI0851558.1 hypothetical protein F5Y00DRAFT_259562 [Daldinia vernicosa]
MQQQDALGALLHLSVALDQIGPETVFWSPRSWNTWHLERGLTHHPPPSPNNTGQTGFEYHADRGDISEFHSSQPCNQTDHCAGSGSRSGSAKNDVVGSAPLMVPLTVFCSSLLASLLVYLGGAAGPRYHIQ